MTEKYIAGVDLGTGATKTALYRQDGTLVAEAIVEVQLHHLRPGAVEQDQDDFYTTACQTIHQCITQSGIDVVQRRQGAGDAIALRQSLRLPAFHLADTARS